MADSVERVLLNARKHAKKGELQAAEQLYLSVLAKFPKNKRASQGLKALGTVKPKASAPDVNVPRGVAAKLMGLYEQEAFEETVQLATQLTRSYPSSASLYNLLGAAYSGLGEMDKALTSYRTAVRLDPDKSDSHNNLGVAQVALKHYKEGIASYHEAIRLDPADADAYNNLGNALQILGEKEPAEEQYRKAIQLSPRMADAHRNLGSVLKEQDRIDDAIDSFEMALKYGPKYAETYANMGNCLAQIGQIDEAFECAQKAIELDENLASSYGLLASLRRPETVKMHLGKMHELFQSPDVSDKDKIHLGFALGRASEVAGNYEESFRYFVEANRLKKAEIEYDIAKDIEMFDRIRKTFAGSSPEAEETENSAPETGITPVFVLGMPRSGTTLVEQILASHSKVHGAGELGLIADEVKKIDWQPPALSKPQSDSIRQGYLEGLSALKIDAEFVTDKMPLNFRWIGFILSAFPEAKIICLRRDARANCWSMFSQNFASSGNDFIYDLEEVAAYFRLFTELMAFWHEEFPNRILDVNYEELTENQVEGTEKLLEFVGLDWEPQCLEFHKTKRSVKTASLVQVRKQMYKGSSEVWRNYESHLAKLVSDLEGL